MKKIIILTLVLLMTNPLFGQLLVGGYTGSIGHKYQSFFAIEYTVSRISIIGTGTSATFNGGGTVINSDSTNGTVLKNGGTLQGSCGLKTSFIDVAGSYTLNISRVIITGSQSDALTFSSGANTLTLSGGGSGNIDMGGGNDTVIVGSTYTGNLDGGAGTDALTLNGGTAGTISNFESLSGTGHPSISAISGIGTINLTQLTISGSQTNALTFGSGANTLTLSGGGSGNIDMGGGNDTLIVSSTYTGNLDGGAGTDTLTISGGTVSGTLSNFEKLIVSDSVSYLNTDLGTADNRVTVTSNRGLAISSGKTLYASTVTFDTTGIVKIILGAGTLNISGAITGTTKGEFQVSNLILSGNASGNITIAKTHLYLDGLNYSDIISVGGNTVTVTLQNSATFAGSFPSAGWDFAVGTGTNILDTNLLTPKNVTINGTLQIASGHTLTTASGRTNQVKSGGTLDISKLADNTAGIAGAGLTIVAGGTLKLGTAKSRNASKITLTKATTANASSTISLDIGTLTTSSTTAIFHTQPSFTSGAGKVNLAISGSLASGVTQRFATGDVTGDYRVSPWFFELHHDGTNTVIRRPQIINSATVTITESLSDALTFGSGANTLTLSGGGSGAIDMGGGNDTLIVSSTYTGNLDGGAGTDTLTLNGGTVSGTLTNFEKLTVSGTSHLNTDLGTADNRVAVTNNGVSLTIDSGKTLYASTVTFGSGARAIKGTGTLHISGAIAGVTDGKILNVSTIILTKNASGDMILGNIYSTVVVLDGLSYTNDITGDGGIGSDLTLQNGATFGGFFFYLRNLTVSGTGTNILYSYSPSGNITISGLLQIASRSTLTTASGKTNQVTSGGTLDISKLADNTAGIGGAGITIVAGGTLKLGTAKSRNASKITLTKATTANASSTISLDIGTLTTSSSTAIFHTKPSLTTGTGKVNLAISGSLASGVTQRFATGDVTGDYRVSSWLFELHHDGTNTVIRSTNFIRLNSTTPSLTGRGSGSNQDLTAGTSSVNVLVEGSFSSSSSHLHTLSNILVQAGATIGNIRASNIDITSATVGNLRVSATGNISLTQNDNSATGGNLSFGTLTGGTGTLTFTNNDSNSAIVLSSSTAISGFNSLVLAGLGSFTLNTNVTISGNTSLSAVLGGTGHLTTGTISGTETINLSQVTITGTQATALTFGSGATTLTLSGGGSGAIDLGGGNDSLTISSTYTGDLDGGAGTDSFILSGGTISGTLSNFESLAVYSSVSVLDADLTISGSLSIGSTGNLQIASGHTLTVGGNVVVYGTLQLASGATLATASGQTNQVNTLDISALANDTAGIDTNGITIIAGGTLKLGTAERRNASNITLTKGADADTSSMITLDLGTDSSGSTTAIFHTKPTFTGTGKVNLAISGSLASNATQRFATGDVTGDYRISSGSFELHYNGTNTIIRNETNIRLNSTTPSLTGRGSGSNQDLTDGTSAIDVLVEGSFSSSSSHLHTLSDITVQVGATIGNIRASNIDVTSATVGNLRVSGTGNISLTQNDNSATGGNLSFGTLTGGTGTLTFTNNDSNSAIVLSSSTAISGFNSLVFAGLGSFTLNTSVTISGNTTLSAGLGGTGHLTTGTISGSGTPNIAELTITGTQANALTFGSGANTVTLSGGGSGAINLGGGNDILTVSSTYTGVLDGGGGTDTLTINGGTVSGTLSNFEKLAVSSTSTLNSNLTLSGNTTLNTSSTLSGTGHLSTATTSGSGTLNTATITITGSQSNGVSFGTGANTLTLSGGGSGAIDLGGGNDSLTVSSTYTGAIDGGAGSDTLTINGGTVSGTLSNFETLSVTTSASVLNSNLSVGSATLAGNLTGSGNLTVTGNTTATATGQLNISGNLTLQGQTSALTLGNNVTTLNLRTGVHSEGAITLGSGATNATITITGSGTYSGGLTGSGDDNLSFNGFTYTGMATGFDTLTIAGTTSINSNLTISGQTTLSGNLRGTGHLTTGTTSATTAGTQHPDIASLTITGNQTNNIQFDSGLGGGANTVTLSGGGSGAINLGSRNDTLIVSSTYTGDLDGGAGTDTLTINGGTVSGTLSNFEKLTVSSTSTLNSNLTLSGNTTLNTSSTLSGTGHLSTATTSGSGTLNTATVTITGSQSNGVSFGTGANTVTLSGGGSGAIDLGGGNDSLTISSTYTGNLDGGGGTDTLRLKGGTVSGTLSNFESLGVTSSGGVLNSNLSVGSATLAGNLTGTGALTVTGNTTATATGQLNISGTLSLQGQTSDLTLGDNVTTLNLKTGSHIEGAITLGSGATNATITITGSGTYSGGLTGSGDDNLSFNGFTYTGTATGFDSLTIAGTTNINTNLTISGQTTLSAHLNGTGHLTTGTTSVATQNQHHLNIANLTITGNQTNAIQFDNGSGGANTVTLSGGGSGRISLGKGNDTLIVSSNYTGELRGQDGTDTLRLSGGTVSGTLSGFDAFDVATDPTTSVLDTNFTASENATISGTLQIASGHTLTTTSGKTNRVNSGGTLDISQLADNTAGIAGAGITILAGGTLALGMVESRNTSNITLTKGESISTSSTITLNLGTSASSSSVAIFHTKPSFTRTGKVNLAISGSLASNATQRFATGDVTGDYRISLGSFELHYNGTNTIIRSVTNIRLNSTTPSLTGRGSGSNQNLTDGTSAIDVLVEGSFSSSSSHLHTLSNITVQAGATIGNIRANNIDVTSATVGNLRVSGTGNISLTQNDNGTTGGNLSFGTLTGGTGTLTFTNNDSNSAIVLNSSTAISGFNSLVLNGTGSFTLNTNVTISGNTTLSAGLGGTGHLTTGTISGSGTLNTATITITSSQSNGVSFGTGANTLTLSGGGSGAIDLGGGNDSLTVSSTYTGALDGGAGTDTLRLSGGTVSGTLSNFESLEVTSSGGVLNSNLSVESATLAGVLTGSGNLTVTGNTTATATGQLNISGNLTLQGQTSDLTLGDNVTTLNLTTGSHNEGAITLGSGADATITITGSGTYSGNLTGSGDDNLSFNGFTYTGTATGFDTLTIAGTTTLNSDLTISGQTTLSARLSGTGHLTTGTTSATTTGTQHPNIASLTITGSQTNEIQFLNAAGGIANTVTLAGGGSGTIKLGTGNDILIISSNYTGNLLGQAGDGDTLRLAGGTVSGTLSGFEKFEVAIDATTSVLDSDFTATENATISGALQIASGHTLTTTSGKTNRVNSGGTLDISQLADNTAGIAGAGITILAGGTLALGTVESRNASNITLTKGESISTSSTITLNLGTSATTSTTAIFHTSPSFTGTGTVALEISGTLAEGATQRFATGDVTGDYRISSGSFELHHDGTNTIIRVVLVNKAPVISGATSFNADENQTSAFTVVVSDPNNDTLNYILSGDDSSLFQVDSNGVVTFKTAPNFENPSDNDTDNTYEVTVTVDDGQTPKLSDSQSYTVMLQNVNEAPTVSSEISDVTYAENASISLDVSSHFADVDTGTNLTFTATGLPTGLTMNTAGVISGSVTDDSQVKVHTVEVTASDGSLSVTDTFTLTIINATNTPIIVSPISDVTYAENASISLNVSSHFTDADGTSLTFTATGLPMGLTMNTAGVISGSVTDDSQIGEHTVEVTASDGVISETNTFTITITNVNDAPTVATPISDVAYAETVPIRLDISSHFVDVDTGTSLTFTAMGLPTGLTMNTAGVISGSVTDDSQIAEHTVEVTASDGSSSVINTFTLTIASINDVVVIASQRASYVVSIASSAVTSTAMTTNSFITTRTVSLATGKTQGAKGPDQESKLAARTAGGLNYNIWQDFSLGFGGLDSNSTSKGYDFSSYSIRMGIDKSLENTIVGFAFSYTTTSFDNEGTTGESDLSTLGFSFYGSYTKLEKYRIDYLASYAINDIEYLGTNTGSLSSNLMDIDTTAHYTGLKTYTPFVGLRLIFNDISSYTLSGTLPMQVAGESYNSFYINFGIRWDRDMSADKARWKSSRYSHNLGLKTSFHYNLMDTKREIKATFQGVTTPFELQGVEEDKFNIGLGIDYSLVKNKMIWLFSYDMFFGSKANSQHLNLKANYRF